MGSFMFSGCFRFENQIRKKQASIGRKDRGFGVFGLSIGVRKGTFPTKYLSMLLGTQFKSSCVWDPIEDRFKEISIPL